MVKSAQILGMDFGLIRCGRESWPIYPRPGGKHAENRPFAREKMRNLALLVLVVCGFQVAAQSIVGPVYAKKANVMRCGEVMAAADDLETARGNVEKVQLKLASVAGASASDWEDLAGLFQEQLKAAQDTMALLEGLEMVMFSVDSDRPPVAEKLAGVGKVEVAQVNGKLNVKVYGTAFCRALQNQNRNLEAAINLIISEIF